ncbi:MAG: hypothetical protein H0T91_03250 [Propionibacteriaceae bacterium]|nr:hypothetical protein [Propionibacteriaceae bacterium]
MATWEDGPEYAPLERPDGFSLPDVPPLEPAPPVEQLAAAPQDRPHFAGPQAVVAALATLVPVVAEQRDPATPFTVVSSTLTSMDSAWGAAHWSPPAGPPIPVAGAQSPWPAVGHPSPMALPVAGPAAGWDPATNTPWPVPSVSPGGYPSPGTPGWFGPGPASEQQYVPARVDARQVFDAATPGLCICLAIGGFIFLLAPVTLGVAAALSSRVSVAKEQVRRTFRIALGVLGFFALVGALNNDGTFGGWWSLVGGWALVISWVVLIITLTLVYRALKNAPPGPTYPPYSSNWG